MRCAFSMLVAGLLLTACAETTTTGSATGPGSSIPSPALAGEIFANVCLATGPGFVGADEAVARYPMNQNPTTGTYFHRSENLSVNSARGRCSLVFASRAGPETVIPELARATAANVDEVPRGIDIVSSPRADDGLIYFRMVIQR